LRIVRQSVDLQVFTAKERYENLRFEDKNFKDETEMIDLTVANELGYLCITVNNFATSGSCLMNYLNRNNDS
jgi:hypothetical protein